MIEVNDLHSALNATRMARIERPMDIPALTQAMRRAAEDGLPVAVCGGRHAMGGQQFAQGGVLLDTGALDAVHAFDRRAGTITVGAGIQWPALVAWLVQAQADAPPGTAWGIVQKQTGADRLSLGGALAANVHGRGLAFKPIVQDVEAFTLVGPDGVSRRCSRNENVELFRLAIGGYGLFGVVADVTLRLARRRKLRRLVELVEADALPDRFAQRRAAGCLYGDFQFSTDERDAGFMRRGVLSCYEPVDDATPISTGHVELDAADWQRLYRLAHEDRAELYRVYTGFYQRTHGQIYWSDIHQLSVYIDGYHEALDVGRAVKRSEMISELYVPRAALGRFLARLAEELRRRSALLIYGTVRLIERDDETALAWARQDWACVVFNLCVGHDAAGLEASAATFRAAIDVAAGEGGSYFLTYHRWATRAQVEACHPRLSAVLDEKRRHDPEERLRSDWYDHHRRLLS